MEVSVVQKRYGLKLLAAVQRTAQIEGPEQAVNVLTHMLGVPLEDAKFIVLNLEQL